MSARRIGEIWYAVIAGLRALVLDLLVPACGLYLAFRLAQGAIEPNLFPIVVPLTTGMLGLPFLRRSNDRNGSDDDDAGAKRKRRRKKRLTIDWGGDDADDDKT